MDIFGQNNILVQSLLSKVGNRNKNFQIAREKLSLTPQESALYSRHLDNLYSSGGVDNPDGSRSTLYQTTVGIDGRQYIIPTVWNGKILSVENAIREAEKIGLDKFPSYSSVDEAENRYGDIHRYMEQDMSDYFASKNKSPSK